MWPGSLFLVQARIGLGGNESSDKWCKRCVITVKWSIASDIWSDSLAGFHKSGKEKKNKAADTTQPRPPPTLSVLFCFFFSFLSMLFFHRSSIFSVLAHAVTLTEPHLRSFFFFFFFNPTSFSIHSLPPALPLTHSSESRSFSSLFLSLKQPRECMLSSTSGSISSAEGKLRMVTFLGTGCSGSGSFFPPLGKERNFTTNKDTVRQFAPYYNQTTLKSSYTVAYRGLALTDYVRYSSVCLPHYFQNFQVTHFPQVYSFCMLASEGERRSASPPRCRQTTESRCKVLLSSLACFPNLVSSLFPSPSFQTLVSYVILFPLSFSLSLFCLASSGECISRTF